MQHRNDALVIIDRLFGNGPGWWQAVAEARDELHRMQLVYEALGAIPELADPEDKAPRSAVRRELALLLAVPHLNLEGRTGIEALWQGDTLAVSALLTPLLLSSRVAMQGALLRDIEIALEQPRRGETVTSACARLRRRSAEDFSDRQREALSRTGSPRSEPDTSGVSPPSGDTKDTEPGHAQLRVRHEAHRDVNVAGNILHLGKERMGRAGPFASKRVVKIAA